jgi:hypothetical protein
MTIALRSRDRVVRVLPDGSYDVFIVDASPDAGTDVMLLSLTVLSGPSKGEVIDIRAEGLGRDELDLLGLPATLVVENGAPRVTVDD